MVPDIPNGIHTKTVAITITITRTQTVMAVNLVLIECMKIILFSNMFNQPEHFCSCWRHIFIGLLKEAVPGCLTDAFLLFRKVRRT